MSAFRIDFDKTTSKFLIKPEKLLEKYNKIWKKVCNMINIIYQDSRSRIIYQTCI